MKSSLTHSVRPYLASFIALLLLAFQAGGAVLYWNNNGTGTPSSGTWDLTTKNWATASALTNGPIVWNTADAACFAAGATSPSGTLNITVNSAISCAGIFNGPLAPPGCNLVIGGTGSLNFIAGNDALDTSGSNGDPTTINVPITGPGAAAVEGGAQLYLNATNTYTGGTLLGYAGNAFTSIINFNNPRAFGTGTITVTNTAGVNAALQVVGSDAMTITNALALAATNAYSGLNLVGNAAGLTLSGPITLNSKTLGIGSGGSGGLVTILGVISGSGAVSANVASTPGTLIFAATNTYTGVTTVSNGVLQLGDGVSRNGTVAGNITVTSSGTLLWDNPSALTYSKVISGAGGIVKTNAGVLTLSGANTYSNLTTISSGATVKVGVANALPSGTGRGDVQLDGTLDLGGFNTGAGALNGAGTVDNSTGTNTYTLTIGANGDGGTFTGTIKNTSGTVALTKNGGGTQNLGAANTYSGLTTISGGTLQLGVNNAIPAASSVVVNSAGALDLNGLNDTVAALGGSGTVNNLSGTLTVNGNAANSGSQNFNGYSCLAGTVNCSGTLVKSGTHAMSVRGNLSSSFSGTLTFSGGTLSVGAAPNLLPSTLPLTVPNGALFQLDANAQTISTLNGSGSVNLGGGTLTIAQGSSDTFNGVLQNSELPGSSTAFGNGLRGYYYTNVDLTVLGAVRDDATVNLPDMTTLPWGYVAGVSKTNQISVRWVGKLLTTVSGDYVISTRCDDGARLWVNGVLVVDDWTTHGATTRNSTNTLSANTQYDIVFEYFNNTSGGSAQLLWTPPGDTSLVVIPSSNLLLPGPGTLVMGGTSSSASQKLAAASTYTGGTSVNGGTLEAGTGGALGGGSVTVNSGATLTLDSSTAIASSADLIVNGGFFVNLHYSGTDIIRGLSLDGGATYQPPGTYGASANNPGGLFTGSGLIQVSASSTVNTLTSTPASPVTVAYGTAVTLTSTLTPSAAGGTVTFYDGANLLGTSPVVSGVATLSVSTLLVDGSPHQISAIYSGDATHDPSQSAPGAVSVTTTPVTLNPTLTITKVYDGTTTAPIVALSGMLLADSNYLHIASGYTATFTDSKDVGNGKPVSVTGMTLAGSLADNYTLSTTSTNTTGSITPKPLTVTGITAAAKVYNATTAAFIYVTNAALQAAEAPGSGTTADGKPYTGDTVNLVTNNAVGNFSDPNVANSKTVTITGLTLGGAQAGDYSVTSPTTTANITKGSTQDNFTSSLNPSTVGANVTFTATISAVAPAAGTPTGNVIFATNGVAWSTNALSGGVASASISTLPQGTTPMLAWYTGDSNFNGVTNNLSQVVNAASTCSSTNTFLSITPNMDGSFTLSIVGTPQAQYYLVSSAIPAASLSTWQVVPGSTNTAATGTGLFSITVTNPSPAFYRCRAMNPCP